MTDGEASERLTKNRSQMRSSSGSPICMMMNASSVANYFFLGALPEPRTYCLAHCSEGRK